MYRYFQGCELSGEFSIQSELGLQWKSHGKFNSSWILKKRFSFRIDHHEIEISMYGTKLGGGGRGGGVWIVWEIWHVENPYIFICKGDNFKLKQFHTAFVVPLGTNASLLSNFIIKRYAIVGLSIRMHRNYLIADLLKMIWLRQLSVK